MKAKKPGLSHHTAMVLGSALLIVLSSLLNISPYGTDFKFSLGAVALPVLCFFVRTLPVLPAAALGGAGVFVVRCVGFFANGASPAAAVSGAWPEFIFYCVFGLLLAMYVHFASLYPFRLVLVLPLALIDFSANVVELTLRMSGAAFTGNRLLPLAVAAVCRMLIAALAVWMLERYGGLVLRRQDALRYRRLLLMTSMLESELFWMQKGAASIEETMTAAYELYQGLAGSEAGQPYTARAMQVATDIHEVKKEYLLITRGIEEALKTSTQKDGMAFSEICDILQESFARSGLPVRIGIEITQDFYTRSHYALMSVLHNLLSNAVEAAGEETARVRLTQRRQGEDYIVAVADSSGGIDEAYREQIFLPGFSSKMDSDTGQLNRGLGLCIVKKLVEEKFGGRVEVAAVGNGSVFTLSLLVQALEDEV